MGLSDGVHLINEYDDDDDDDDDFTILLSLC